MTNLISTESILLATLFLIILLLVSAVFMKTTVSFKTPMALGYIALNVVFFGVIAYHVIANEVAGKHLASVIFTGLILVTIYGVTVLKATKGKPDVISAILGVVIGIWLLMYGVTPDTKTPTQQGVATGQLEDTVGQKSKPVKGGETKAPVTGEAQTTIESKAFDEKYRKYCETDKAMNYPVCHADYATYFKEAYTSPVDGTFLQYLSNQRKGLEFITREVEETSKKLAFITTLQQKMVVQSEADAKLKVTEDFDTYNSSLALLNTQQATLLEDVALLEELAELNHAYMTSQGWTEDAYKKIDYPNDELDGSITFSYLEFVTNYVGALSLAPETLKWVESHKENKKSEG